MPSPGGGPRAAGAALSTRERLLFEAGIKLGGIFHQYVGVPVSPRTAPGLARTIERAVRLQPYVRRVRVRIHLERGGPPPPAGRYGYRYVTGEMLEVTVTLAEAGHEIVARLDLVPELRYALMQVSRARGPRAGARLATRRARPGDGN